MEQTIEMPSPDKDFAQLIHRNDAVELEAIIKSLSPIETARAYYQLEKTDRIRVPESIQSSLQGFQADHSLL
jgi:hypothetical protein